MLIEVQFLWVGFVQLSWVNCSFVPFYFVYIIMLHIKLHTVNKLLSTWTLFKSASYIKLLRSAYLTVTISKSTGFWFFFRFFSAVISLNSCKSFPPDFLIEVEDLWKVEKQLCWLVTFMIESVFCICIKHFSLQWNRRSLSVENLHKNVSSPCSLPSAVSGAEDGGQPLSIGHKEEGQ